MVGLPPPLTFRPDEGALLIGLGVIGIRLTNETHVGLAVDPLGSDANQRCAIL